MSSAIPSEFARLFENPLFKGSFGDGVGRELIEGLRLIAMAIGLLFLIGGYIERANKESQRGGTMPLTSTIMAVVLAVLLMGGGGRVLSLTAEAGDEIPVALGVGDTKQFIGQALQRVVFLGSNPMDVFARAFSALFLERVSTDVESRDADGKIIEQPEEPGVFQKLSPGAWLAYAYKWLLDWIYAVYALLIKFAFFILFFIAILIAALMQILMNGARFLALVIGSALLPLFIGMMGWERAAGIGRSYIVQLVAVCFWPIGWALGNIVSLELMDVSMNVATSGGLKADVDKTFAAAMSGQGLSQTDIQRLYDMLNPGTGAITLVIGCLMALMTIIWIIASPITVAKAVTKTLTSGSEFVAGALGSTAMSTARVTSEATKVAVRGGVP